MTRETIDVEGKDLVQLLDTLERMAGNRAIAIRDLDRAEWKNDPTKEKVLENVQKVIDGTTENIRAVRVELYTRFKAVNGSYEGLDWAMTINALLDELQAAKRNKMINHQEKVKRNIEALLNFLTDQKYNVTEYREMLEFILNLA